MNQFGLKVSTCFQLTVPYTLKITLLRILETFELLYGPKDNALTVSMRVTPFEICIRLNLLSLSYSIQLPLYSLFFFKS